MTDKIGTQLWIQGEGDLPINSDLIKPVSNDNGIAYKGNGGLWTSTYMGKKEGSDWIQWCIGNEFRCPSNGLWKGYLLNPKNDLRIYTINSLKEMHTLYDTYGYKPYPVTDMEGIDFVKMSEDYDGLHLTSYGEAVTRHGFNFFGGGKNEILKSEWKAKTLRSFYGWDCESTYHFRWNFESVEEISLNIKSQYDDEENAI